MKKSTLLLIGVLTAALSGTSFGKAYSPDLQKASSYSLHKSVADKLMTSPADSLIFADDFEKHKAGSSATNFKTNGAALINTVPGQTGKWMVLQDKAIYKLTKPLIYPENFTLEFDLLATGDQIKDIAPLSFGFATDNSVSKYTSNNGAYVELHYYDADMVNIGNSDPKQFINAGYDLTADLNRPLHIKLVINAERMAVFLNDTKLADTVLFKRKAAKNFYITAPWAYENGAKLFVSNFQIRSISK